MGIKPMASVYQSTELSSKLETGHVTSSQLMPKHFFLTYVNLLVFLITTVNKSYCCSVSKFKPYYWQLKGQTSVLYSYTKERNPCIGLSCSVLNTKIALI